MLVRSTAAGGEYSQSHSHSYSLVFICIGVANLHPIKIAHHTHTVTHMSTFTFAHCGLQSCVLCVCVLCVCVISVCVCVLPHFTMTQLQSLSWMYFLPFIGCLWLYDKELIRAIIWQFNWRTTWPCRSYHFTLLYS